MLIALGLMLAALAVACAIWLLYANIQISLSLHKSDMDTDALKQRNSRLERENNRLMRMVEGYQHAMHECAQATLASIHWETLYYKTLTLSHIKDNTHKLSAHDTHQKGRDFIRRRSHSLNEVKHAAQSSF
jgi:hypothetical protein